MNFANTNILVIGGGKLGMSFADYFMHYSCSFSLLVRSDASAKRATEAIPHYRIVRSLDELSDVPELIILCVRDGEINTVSGSIAQHFGDKLANKHIIHCSGILPSDELIHCKECGAKIASLHPFQTFASMSKEAFYQIPWGIEGDASPVFAEFISFMGGTAYHIRKENKVLYHSAAVTLSNYLNSTLSLASSICDNAEIDINAFAPRIVNSTINNILSSSGASTLTGPIARGDISTIRKHLEGLSARNELAIPYAYMGLATLEMAKNAEIISEEFYSECKELLSSIVRQNEII